MLNVLTIGEKRRHKGTLQSIGFVYYLDCCDGNMGVKLYMLNMCSSLYVNYT